MADISAYTKEEFDQRLGTYIALFRHHYRKASARPNAYLLGGQSGAGKTFLHGILAQGQEVAPVVINGDEYRKSHPRFALLQAKYGDAAVEYTAPWAGKMTEALIDALSKLSYNLIIEGTLRTSDVPMSTARLLRERGYDVSLALMAVKPEISLISCQIRYEEMRIAGTTPRATDPAHHKKIVDDIVSNLSVLEGSGLFDGIYLYTRTGRRLYPAEGAPGEDATASDVLNRKLFGEWSEEEQVHYRHLEDRLQSLRGGD